MPYIYIIHCRASLNSNEPVYKIGKTSDIKQRISGYDKGSVLLFTLYVNECDQFEQYLIQCFNIKYTHRSDYGTEYFEGDLNDMLSTIMNEYSKYTKLTYNCTVEPVKTVNVNKYAGEIRKVLNKINASNINRFQTYINGFISELSSMQMYCVLLNTISNYQNDMMLKKIKFGDYADSNYHYVNNYIAEWNAYPDNLLYLNLFQKIKEFS